MKVRIGLVLIALLAAPAAAQAQEMRASLYHSTAHNLVLPQARAYSLAPGTGRVAITGVTVGVVILEQAATTTMDIDLKNPTGRRLEAELIVPVPAGAVVRGFTFQGAAAEPKAELLPRDEARRTYDGIVAKIRDPALLEFVGYNLIRSSVFPVPPNGTQKVRLTYENILKADGDRIDYELPRSDSLDYKAPWYISVRVKSGRPISTVYSPSHKLETLSKELTDTDGTKLHVTSVRTVKGAEKEPGMFRLSYLIEKAGVTASLLAYPEPKLGGGYFLLLAGLPEKPEAGADGPAIKREVTLVLDHSGSMRGEKIEQVREAAMQILAGLQEGEAFNIMAYNQTVNRFAPAPVVATEKSVKAAGEYLGALRPTGGTNIYDALLEALRQKPSEGMLPIVLFLTDGVPTIGRTGEVEIREMALKANTQQRRIFAFGVGVDVNTPLLEKIALESRATATFVLPRENVEVKVAQVFKRLTGPVLASPQLHTFDAQGKPTNARTLELLPATPPDMFDGDQMVLLGKYVGEEPLTFVLSGNYLGKPRTFRFTFGFDKATTSNSFVPRLWASRQIAVLIDAIRVLGADSGPVTAQNAAADPKLKELVDEIVRLSTEFGILTEYTAFLAREGTDLAARDAVLAEAVSNFNTRAVRTRTGLGSINQFRNNDSRRMQFVANGYANSNFLDANMNRVEITAVQQLNDRAFYRRGDRWVDSRIVGQEDAAEPKTIITFGSEEFRKLAMRLAAEGRQGTISLRGDIVMVVDDEPILVRNGSVEPD